MYHELISLAQATVSSMVTANVQLCQVIVQLFELAYTVIVKYNIYNLHSDISNYTKLAFNSLKMIRNNTVYQPIKRGMIGL